MRRVVAMLVLCLACSRPAAERPVADAEPAMGCKSCALDDGGQCSRSEPEAPGGRAMCAASCCAAWDSVIAGEVVDEVTHARLVGTTVVASGGALGRESRWMVTGPDGTFSIGPLPPGRYSFTVLYRDLVIQRWVFIDDVRTPVSLSVDTRRASGDAVWQQDGCDLPGNCPGKRRGTSESMMPRRRRR